MEENIYQLVLLVHNLENLPSALVHNLELPCQFQTDSKADGSVGDTFSILLDFSLTVKATPHECVIRTSQP